MTTAASPWKRLEPGRPWMRAWRVRLQSRQTRYGRKPGPLLQAQFGRFAQQNNSPHPFPGGPPNAYRPIYSPSSWNENPRRCSLPCLCRETIQPPLGRNLAVNPPPTGAVDGFPFTFTPLRGNKHLGRSSTISRSCIFCCWDIIFYAKIGLVGRAK